MAPVPQAALVLAGGLGTRLQAVVSDRAKPMAEVEGRPFVTRLLDQVAAMGIPRAILCTGHLGDRVEAILGRTWGPVALDYSREASPLGTAGALRLALDRIPPGCGSLLVLNGDSYFGLCPSAFLEAHGRLGGQGTLSLVEVPDSGRFGSVDCGPGGRIRAFREKTGAREPGWINAGVYLLDRALLEEIPPGRAVSLEREMFPAWLDRLRGHRTQGAFLDIGTPETYARAAAFFAALGTPDGGHPQGRQP